MAEGKQPETGVLVVGEFIGAEAGKVWTDRQGVEHHPIVVKVLAGLYIESVEFDSAADVERAIGAPGPRELVRVPVRVRGSWDAAAQRFGRPSFLGRRSEG